MKNFVRRLKYYGLGFGIGLIFVFVFFQNRGCSWLPENRVKNSLMGKVLVVSEETQRKLDQKNFSDSLVVSFLNDADISFGSSKKKGEPKVYSLKKKVNGEKQELWFTLSDNAYISEVLVPTGSIQKAENSQEGLGRMVHFPNVPSFVYLSDNQVISSQMREFGIRDAKTVQYLLKKGGIIDFSKSNLKADPSGEQFVLLPRSSGDTLKARTVWYKDHIQFQQFEK